MYNKVIMVGNLTRDIELKYLPSGSAVAKSAIATSYKFKTQTGEQKEEVCFLDFNVFGKQAEVLNQYVRKGSKVLVEGRLVLETWVGPDGNNRSKHSLRVESFKFLDSKSDNLQNNYNPYGANQQPQPSQPNNYQINNQPQQMNYQQNSYQSEPAYSVQTQTNKVADEPEKLPEIDVNDDSIPF